jgi:CTP synthase
MSAIGNLEALLVAPGFGHRGIEGKIIAVKYARVNKLPFFGICLGMQMAAIEFARNVLGLTDAHSTEMQPDTKTPVIDLMPEQKKITAKGGTMRLGAYSCVIKDGTLASRIYGKRNKRTSSPSLEFNNAYLDQFEHAGMIASGQSGKRIGRNHRTKDHPFFIGVQYHPELKALLKIRNRFCAFY